MVLFSSMGTVLPYHFYIYIQTLLPTEGDWDINGMVLTSSLSYCFLTYFFIVSVLYITLIVLNEQSHVLLLFFFLPVSFPCLHQLVLICAESQAEAKIKNDLSNVCIYIYIYIILKRKSMGILTVWICKKTKQSFPNWIQDQY